MMYNYISIIILSVFFLISCKATPGKIPTGTWNYSLHVNGVNIGNAKISSKMENNHYITTSEMIMDAGYIKNRTKQTAVETLDFKPVRLEINSSINNKNMTQKVNTLAVFNSFFTFFKTDKIHCYIHIRPFKSSCDKGPCWMKKLFAF